MAIQQNFFNSIHDVLDAVDAVSNQLVSQLHERFPGCEQYVVVQQEGAWTIWNEIKINYSNVEVFGRNFQYILLSMVDDLFGQPVKIEEMYAWSPRKRQTRDTSNSLVKSTYTYQRDGLEVVLELGWQMNVATIVIAEQEEEYNNDAN